MIHAKAFLPLLLAVAGLPASAYEYERWSLPSPAPHKTIEREERGTIASVWPDLRFGGPFLRPPLAMPRQGGMVDLSFRQLDQQRNPHADLEPRRQQSFGITLRQQLLPWLGIDSGISGVREPATGEEGLADWRSTLVVFPWQRRYQGVALELGVSEAVMDGGLLEAHHQRAWRQPTLVAGVRYGVAWGFLVVTANLGGEWQSKGSADLPDRLSAEGGTMIGPGPWPHRYVAGEAGLGVSYRCCRFFRLGVEGLAHGRWWRGLEDDHRLHDWGMPMVVYGEVTPFPHWLLRGGVGRDVLDPELRGRGGWNNATVTGSLVVAW